MPARTPRRSLTKTQLETPAGAELLALCQSFTEDGRITPDEIAVLRDWLDRNRGSGLPSEEFLASTVERILEDGRITPEETEELYRALETVLPPDLRKDAQQKRREVEAAKRQAAKEARAAAKEAAEAERLRNEPIDTFDFMVAGTTREGRDQIVRELLDDDGATELVYLARDRGNRHSRHAVEVRLPDGRCIGYVPEWSKDVRARDVARHLDSGARHRAWIKRVLTGGRAPIVVVVADMFAPDVQAEGAVTQADVPQRSAGKGRGRSGCLSAFLVACLLLAILVVGGIVLSAIVT